LSGAAVAVVGVAVVALLGPLPVAVAASDRLAGDVGDWADEAIFKNAAVGAAVARRRASVVALLLGRDDAVATGCSAAKCARNGAVEARLDLRAGGVAAVSAKAVAIVAGFGELHESVAAGVGDAVLSWDSADETGLDGTSGAAAIARDGV